MHGGAEQVDRLYHVANVTTQDVAMGSHASSLVFFCAPGSCVAGSTSVLFNSHVGAGHDSQSRCFHRRAQKAVRGFMTIQTQALGAPVRWPSCNIYSTQDHAAAGVAKVTLPWCSHGKKRHSRNIGGAASRCLRHQVRMRAARWRRRNRDPSRT